MARKYTKELFIEKSRHKHGNKYDYSYVEYINSTTPVKIICPIHGEFNQRPVSHLQYGCAACAGCRKHSRETFIEKAIQKHGDKYDYSLVTEIKNTHDQKVNIRCKIHGTFTQTPHAHLAGQGCQKCYNERRKYNRLIHSKERCIEKSKLYNTVSDMLESKDSGCYYYASEHGFVNELCFKRDNIPHKRHIYVFDFKGVVAYVGLTCDLERRIRQHLTSYRSPVKQYIDKGHKDYKIYWLENDLEEKDASDKERYWIDQYKNAGYWMLNSAPGGSLGGNLKRNNNHVK